MKLRAFIFDGEAIIRQLLKALLERRGYEVFAYPYAINCGECNGLNCADVIICDVMLYQGSGIGFIQGQRKIGCCNDNIALIAGSWNPENLAASRQLGCQTFTKPFTMDELEVWLQVVESKIDQSRQLSDYYHTHTKVLADSDE